MNTDTALLQRESDRKPIRVGMVGAGATGRAIALQLGTPVPGMRLVAIANRTPEHGERAFREGGFQEWRRAVSAREAEAAINSGVPVLTDDPSVLTTCPAIDLLVEVTGTIDFALGVVLQAFQNGKHVVLVNAELDSLLGPILKARADSAGVVVTHTDGDEPGVAMTLLRYLRLQGLRPVAAGNIKGMVDHYRTPETQRGFAEKYDQDVRRFHQTVHGNNGSSQRHWVPCWPPGHVWAVLLVRKGTGKTAAGRTDARNRPRGLFCGGDADDRRLGHCSRRVAS